MSQRCTCGWELPACILTIEGIPITEKGVLHVQCPICSKIWDARLESHVQHICGVDIKDLTIEPRELMDKVESISTHIACQVCGKVLDITLEPSVLRKRIFSMKPMET
jgi:hypothetical protein